MSNKQSTLEKECINWGEIKDLRQFKNLGSFPLYEGQKIRALKIDGVYEIIDLEIADLIEDLNKAGRRTSGCCAGHKEESNKFGICRGYISFENTKENRLFISSIVLRRLENSTPADKSYSEFLIEAPCIIRFRYDLDKREEMLQNFIKLFYDKTGNIISDCI